MALPRFHRVVAIAALLALSGCATAPRQINDVCSVFEQNDGWLNNWREAAEQAEGKHGVPVPVLMATLRKESGFKSNARPPRTKLLGFIPWTRVSSAYGYSQALDGTWAQYRSEAGSFGASRSDFADAIDFVGWYHSKTAASFGVSPGDTYNLYLAYYAGWTGYKRGAWRSDDNLQRYARDTEAMAQRYAAQLQACSS